MLKRAIFAGAALVIGAAYMQVAVTPALAGQMKVKPKISVKPKVSVKPKMRIRVVRPKVRIKINPNQLGRDTLEKKKRDTTPRLAKPGGAPAGYDNASMPAGDIPTPVTDTVDAPNTPKLDVPDSLRDLFEVTGGNLNDIRDAASLLEDGLDGQNALPEIPGASGEFPGGIGGDRPFGANRVGVMDPFGGRGEAFGPGGYNDEFGVDMMAGIPRSPASTAPGSGGVASSGWTNGGRGYFTRENKNSIDVFVTNFSDPTQVTIRTNTIDTVSDGFDSTSEIVVVVDMTTGKWTSSKFNSEGVLEQIDSGQVTPGKLPPTQHDQDGDGVPDEAGQPIPDGGGAAEGICTGWTPLGGCGLPGLSIWEITGQPGSEDGTGTTRSAGASIGPEAVTNTGDGGFIAGEGRGGGGSMIDPCATVAGCGGPGGGGGGPGPAGSEGPPASR